MSNSLLRTNKDIVDIYNRHVDTIYRVSFMYMKNSNDAEDIVQNTFIKLMQFEGTFESIEHEKAWLIRTASNDCKNVFKHWFRKRLDVSEIGDIPAKDRKKDETLELVLALPNKYKDVIYLYYYEGYTTNEIATILNVNESTVRSHLLRGRNYLKNIIGSESYEK